MNEAHLRELLRGDLRIRAYLNQRFTVEAQTDEDIGRFYANHPELFTRNGRLMPISDVREDVLQAVLADRQRVLVEDWVADLRRRADVIDLYSK